MRFPDRVNEKKAHTSVYGLAALQGNSLNRRVTKVVRVGLKFEKQTPPRV